MAVKLKLKQLPFVRMNSRVRIDQQKFIKSYARKMRLTDGEAHRQIIDRFMTNY